MFMLAKDFSGNWFGSMNPVISTANSSEPGYAAQIPVVQAQGLIVVRAPLRGRAFQAEIESYLQRAQCGTARG